MEIYNHGCEHDGLYGFNPQVYDEMLRAGQRLYALSTDDNHDTRPIGDPLNDSFGGFVQIAAKELTYPAVMEALQAGRFYWSQGPQILGLSIEGGALKVKTSPVEKIFVTVEGRNSYKAVVAPGESLTEATFPLSGKEGWFRTVERCVACSPGATPTSSTSCKMRSKKGRSSTSRLGVLSFYDSIGSCFRQPDTHLVLAPVAPGVVGHQADVRGLPLGDAPGCTAPGWAGYASLPPPGG